MHVNDPATQRLRRIGIAWICLTTVMFALLDASAKWLVQSFPVFQVIWMRFLVHTVLTAALFAPKVGHDLYRVKHPKLQFLRGLMLATMTALNFFALQYLQLAETSAMQFSVPIMIALFSVWWLGERQSTSRWVAIAAGFVGVLVIIRPWGHGFHPAIFLTLLNAIMYAVFNMITRHVGAQDHPAATQWISALVPSVLMAPLGLWQWQTPHDIWSWLFILSAGLTGGMGHFASAMAHRYASAAVLGPFLYQQIIYMTLLGWLLFGQLPDAAVVAGAILVVCSGLFLLRQEFRSNKTIPEEQI
jgi:drug/metabolite transporter (DMT)-like permease